MATATLSKLPHSKQNKRGQEHDATKDKKMPRSHRSSEGENPTQVLPGISYNDAATSHLKVAIINKDNSCGEITTEREILVKKTLMGELDKTMLSTSCSKTKPPTFRSWSYSGVIIRVTCDDDLTLEWLKTKVLTLKTWEGATLAVVRMDELPKLTKASLWIQGEEKADLDEKKVVLRRLEGQNPNLHVAKWCTFHHEIKKDSKGHLFNIGDEDMGTLKAKSIRMSYEFTSLIIRPMVEKEAEAGPSKDSLINYPLSPQFKPTMEDVEQEEMAIDDLQQENSEEPQETNRGPGSNKRGHEYTM
ncbi:unnamed protein product [Psylliodes chrysocephalus]|uniref:DUF4780 domain-containing protein n=1 Tax=Psylliodes chrysocephalus TaxID=3402493 RepID=A0A9P0D069_9CUCU|nr:unnamed protein product [Psylliodes chrysocephala]